MRRLIRVSLQNQHAIAAISFENCPAKTRMLSDGRVVQGRSVLSHCQIVGEIARALIALYPEPMRSRLFPAGWPRYRKGQSDFCRQNFCGM